jgi:hypothetical protein
VYFLSISDNVAESSAVWCGFHHAHLLVFEALPPLRLGRSEHCMFSIVNFQFLSFALYCVAHLVGICVCIVLASFRTLHCMRLALFFF